MTLTKTHCRHESVHTSIDFSTTLNSECLKLQYDSNFKGDGNTHQGQKKLFLSEVQLLTEYYRSHHKNSDEHPTVIYAGASPFHHGPFLHSLFKDVKFILIDPADSGKKAFTFGDELKDQDHFDIRREFFTDKLAEEFRDLGKDHPIIFISDIRLGDPNPIIFNTQIGEQMQKQSNWVATMRPKLSLLKFRVPYLSINHDKQTDEEQSTMIDAIETVKRHAIFRDFPNVKMFDGDLYFQVFPKTTSGETRLMITQQNVDKQQMRVYKFDEYEQILSFHNRYTRTYRFSRGVSEFDPYIFPNATTKESNTHCNCYDCIGELRIYDDYLRYAGQTGVDTFLQIFGVDTLKTSFKQFPFASIEIDAHYRNVNQGLGKAIPMTKIDDVIFNARLKPLQHE